MYLINQLENALRVSVETLRAPSSVLCSDATGEESRLSTGKMVDP